MNKFMRVSNTMPNSGKTNDPVQGKCPDRQKDRKTNRPYFIGTFQLTFRVQQVQLL